jgi:exosome complex RNA-binding protein Csl4
MKVKQIMLSCPNCGAKSNANYKAGAIEAKTDCRNCKTKLVKKWQN